MLKKNFLNTADLLTFIVVSLLICFQFMPVFKGYLGAYPEMILILTGYFLLFPIRLDDLKKTLAIILLTVIFFIGANWLQPSSNIIYIYNVFSGTYFVILPINLIMKKKFNLIKSFFYVFLIAITITQISSIINLTINPMLARDVVFGGVTGEFATFVSRKNVGGFLLAYIAPIITICVYMLVREYKLPKILFWIHCVLSIFFIYKTQFTLALIIYILCIGSLLVFKGDIKKIIIFVVIMILVFSIVKPLISDIVLYMAQNLDSEVLSERFYEIFYLINGVESNGMAMEMRMERYERSLKIFLNNPIIGGQMSGRKE